MKKAIGLITLMFLTLACEESVEQKRGIVAPAKVKAEAPRIEDKAAALQEQGYQTFLYEDGDSTYLMQQYYIVFLKAGENRSQDTTGIAELMEQHLAHLNRMAEEGYSSLTGPMGDDGELRGIVVYNTPTQEEADSLANLDPMVKAGRLEVEVHPWWTAKGGKLP